MTVIRVTRAQVYAARARVALDRQDRIKTPEWVVRLAAVSLAIPERRA